MALLPHSLTCGPPCFSSCNRSSTSTTTRRYRPVRAEQQQQQQQHAANVGQAGPASQRKKLSVAEMKAALGMADERTAGFRPDTEKKIPVLSSLEDAGQYLEDFTDRQSGPIGGGIFLLTMLLFPVWLVYLLTAADMIHPPFPLPFLTN